MSLRTAVVLTSGIRPDQSGFSGIGKDEIAIPNINSSPAAIRIPMCITAQTDAVEPGTITIVHWHLATEALTWLLSFSFSSLRLPP